MTKRERVSRQVPLMILWAMLSALVWSFVFNIITDTDPTRKLTLFADAETPGAAELAAELEKETGAGIRMVKVHPFTYAMMDASEINGSDLYIVSEERFDEFAAWYAPVPESLRDGHTLRESDGEPRGILIHDPEAAPDQAWIRFGQQRYYLTFGVKSRHLPGGEDPVDAEAVACAEHLLRLFPTQ